jgi:hypothetical protein
MHRIRFWTTPVLAALLVAATAGCGAIGNASPRAITSSDGLSRIVMPPGWKVRTDLNEEADIQVGDLRNNVFLIVLSEKKIDFEEIDYHQHSQLTRRGFMENLDNGRVVAGPTRLTINGHNAVQYQLQGSVKGIKIVYLHVTVDGDDAFHQILTWTVPSSLQKNREAMDFLIRSFEEVG